MTNGTLKNLNKNDFTNKNKIRMENIMRQFKFRAWEMNKMYYQVRCGGVFDDIPTAPTVWNDEHGDWMNMTGQPHTVIMQWTGLEDEKGKEIYEGDIIKVWITKTINFVATVVFLNGAFGVGNIPSGYGYHHKFSPFQNNSGTRYEVIGNIYENSELLSE